MDTVPNKKLGRLAKFLHNPIIEFVMLLFSILGIVLALITIMPPVGKQFSYSYESRVVISKNESMIDDLEISYVNKKIEELQSTNIKIWNSGSDIIKHGDIASVRPLTIIFSGGGEIYKVTKLGVNNEANQLSFTWVTGEPNTQIIFEYVGPKDYIEIQVLHSSDIDINVDTVIMGVEQSVKKVDITPQSLFSNGFYQVYLFVMSIISVAMGNMALHKILKRINSTTRLSRALLHFAYSTIVMCAIYSMPYMLKYLHEIT